MDINEIASLKKVVALIESGEYREAADELWVAFEWEKTPPGHVFWSRIVAALEKAAR